MAYENATAEDRERMEEQVAGRGTCGDSCGIPVTPQSAAKHKRDETLGVWGQAAVDFILEVQKRSVKDATYDWLPEERFDAIRTAVNARYPDIYIGQLLEGLQRDYPKDFVFFSPPTTLSDDVRAARKAVEAATGLRYDEGKLRLDLLPPEWLVALAEVMTQGAAKYADRNWENGMAWSKVLGPLMRHLVGWESGENYDKETGCHHLAMVAWNALALMSYDLWREGKPDCKGHFTAAGIDALRTAVRRKE